MLSNIFACCNPEGSKTIIKKDVEFLSSNLKTKDSGEEKTPNETKIKSSENNFEKESSNQFKIINSRSHNRMNEENENSSENQNPDHFQEKNREDYYTESKHSGKDSEMSDIKKNKGYDSTEFGQNLSLYPEDVDYAPKILLMEIEGEILNNEKLQINAFGMVGGARQAKDGITFFGTKIKQDDKIINDYVLNFEHPEIGAFLFIIYYKKDENSYYARSFRDKANKGISMLLIKIDSPYTVHKKEILSISHHYYQVEVQGDSIELIEFPNKSTPEAKKYSFLNSAGNITIGRSRQCSISYPEEKNLSKINTRITFCKEEKNWVLEDGNGTQSSTNGTWIYAAHSYKLRDSSLLKIGSSKIQVKFL